MKVREKTKKISIAFIVIIFICGLLLMYRGNDAIYLASEEKNGILTSEQIKISFDDVSGRLLTQAVQEAQMVKKGDVLLVLDSTDIDLSIAKLEAQIAGADAQIKSLSGTINIGRDKANTTETQNYFQIGQQEAAVNSAKATLANQELDYSRKSSLAGSGAIAQTELDTSLMNLEIARANLRQQQDMLAKLTTMTGGSGNVLPKIEQQRRSLENQGFDVAELQAQKKALEVSLQELKVQKERLILRAPEDGKVLQVLVKEGEKISADTPVILLETDRQYFDIYISEEQAAHLQEGASVKAYTVADHQELSGSIRFINAAPGFAELKMSRERGQADLTAFQIRIYIEPQKNVLPGMTIEVNTDGLLEG